MDLVLHCSPDVAVRTERIVGGRVVRVGYRTAPCRPRQIVLTLTFSTRCSWGPAARPPGLGPTWRCIMTTTPTTVVAVIEPEFSDP